MSFNFMFFIKFLEEPLYLAIILTSLISPLLLLNDQLREASAFQNHAVLINKNHLKAVSINFVYLIITIFIFQTIFCLLYLFYHNLKIQ